MTLPLAVTDIYNFQTQQSYFFFTRTLTLTLVIDHQLVRRKIILIKQIKIITLYECELIGGYISYLFLITLNLIVRYIKFLDVM